MTGRERFLAIFNYQPFDRMPVYFFDAWRETQQRWLDEGLSDWSARAEEAGMDPDWEGGLWTNQGRALPHASSPEPEQVLEVGDDYRIVRTPLGGVYKQSTAGSSISHAIEPDLKPTREDWERFKTFLDPDDPARRPEGWESAADALEQREHATCFFAGSLFGWLRGWMGVEAISYLAYDDPALYEEMIATMADYWMAIAGPVLDRVSFEIGYFFEDCCGSTGPLLSPPLYEKYYDRHYRRMIEFYRSKGVPLLLMDSDGKVDALIPHWLETGMDIIFPIEIGSWQTDPVALRKQYGRRLKMFGGVNKHVIPEGEAAIREHLERLVPLAAEGGYIPIPDHRIPPSCSLEQFRTYVRVFKDVFAAIGG